MTCRECGRVLGFSEATSLGSGYCNDCDAASVKPFLSTLTVVVVALLAYVCWVVGR